MLATILFRRIRWAGNIARMGEINACNILVGKPEGKRPFGKPRSRWENNTRMDLREQDANVWTGLIWLRIGSSGGPLSTW
jgi:hypothetical protein